MPVKATVTPDTYAFIYPSTNWKSMTIKNMSAAYFEVDDEHFYIDSQIMAADEPEKF
jgi:hypothetical protein